MDEELRIPRPSQMTETEMYRWAQRLNAQLSVLTLNQRAIILHYCLDCLIIEGALDDTPCHSPTEGAGESGCR